MQKRKTTHKFSKKHGRSAPSTMSRYTPRYKTLSRGDVVRYFKRPLPDAVLYTTSGPGVVTSAYDNSTSTWLIPGSVSNDNNGAGLGMQFGLGISIQLNTLAQAQDLLSLFRQCTIMGCTVRAEQQSGDSASNAVVGGINSNPGNIVSLVSYENLSSAGTAGSYLQAIAYGNSKQQAITNGRPFVRKFKLRPALNVFSSDMTTIAYAAQNSGKLWVDSQASANTIFYGPGLWLRNFPSTPSNFGLRFMCDVWVACRSPY